MSEFKFKASMFRDCDGSNASLAEKAQAALDAYLKGCEKVYGYKESDGSWYIKTFKSDQDTHEAILFNLRPMEKPECKHEPAPIDDVEGFKSIMVETLKCVYCGAKLKAKWEAVKK